jgi:hypothetical protein
MNVWKNKLVPILFALGAVLFLVPVMKQVIQGEPVKVVFLVLANTFLALAVVFLAVGAGPKSDGGSGPPSA